MPALRGERHFFARNANANRSRRLEEGRSRTDLRGATAPRDFAITGGLHLPTQLDTQCLQAFVSFRLRRYGLKKGR
jgi:hypothetical protein